MTDPQVTWSDPNRPDGSDATWRDPATVGSSGLGPIGERTLPRGTRVGSWEIRGELARGSMGVVYRARQVDLPDREIALKLIAAAIDDPQAQARFQREGEALARLDHPHVVRVHAAGVLDDGRPYLAMELVRGKNLRQLAYEAGSLTPVDGAKLLEPVARAVAHMHERGVLHRDLKLANVLLDEEGQPRVTDFGLAQLTDRGTRLTQSQDLIGTPLYMAPEIVRTGQAPDARADVFALGVMLYRLTVGRFPFYAGTPLALFDLIDRAPLEVPPDLPGALGAVLHTALAKSADDRYPTAEALADDLAALAAGQPVSAHELSAWDRLRRTIHSLRTPLVGVVALTLLAVLTAAGFAIAKLRADRAEAKTQLEAATTEAAQRREEALARVEREGAAPDPATLLRLGALLDGAPAPSDPLSAADHRFLTAHAWVCLLRGQAERATRSLARSQGASELAEVRADLRFLLRPQGEPARVSSTLAAIRARLNAAPIDLFRALDELRASKEGRTPPGRVLEGQLLLQLRWPASAARAFVQAREQLKSWRAGAQPAAFRLRPGDPVRWLPLEVVARCSEARARALLLDREAFERAQALALERLRSLGQTELATALAGLSKGPLPAPAPAFLAQGEAELEAWVCARRRRLRARKPIDDLRPRLERAQRAFELALRQGESAARAWSGLAETAIAQGRLPEARRHAQQAARRDAQHWQVEAARGAVAIAAGEHAGGVARLLVAVERLAQSGAGPIALAAKRYRLLTGGLDALRDHAAPPKARLPLLARLARLSEEVPLTAEMRAYWHGKLQDLASRQGQATLARQGKLGRARLEKAYQEIRRLYDAVEEAGARSHSLDNFEGERLSMALERCSPTAAGAYRQHAYNFLRSDPRSIDPLVWAWLLEPAQTLASLDANLYHPSNRTMWGEEQRDKVLSWVRSGRSTRGLPAVPDARLKEALTHVHCLQMGSALEPADRVVALEKATRFRADHPRFQGAALVLGLLRLALGDPAGGLTELERAEHLHPPFPEQRWRPVTRLIRFHQARAWAGLGDHDRALALVQSAVKAGVTNAWLIEEERRFRIDPDRPTTLREPFRRLIQVQSEVAAARRRRNR